MDPERFDRLAKSVGRGGSRRGLLGGLLGSALLAGGLAGWAPGEEVVAREGVLDGRLGGRHGPNRRGRDRDRAHGDKKEKKKDRKKKQDRDGGRLGSGAPCQSPKTRCGQGKNQTCVDTQTDPKNCGACGTVCGTGEVCQNGGCVCSGCRAGNTCSAGNTWAQCGAGADGAPCAACASGDVCDARVHPNICMPCAVGHFNDPAPLTWCDAVHDFARYQCGARCACAENDLQQGRCFTPFIRGVCDDGPIPICFNDIDCVNQGNGDYCVLAGVNCQEAAKCVHSVCVTACGAGAGGGNTSAGDGPPQIVVRD